MPTNYTLTVRGRRLIQELRRAREEAGFTQAQVAEEMGWSESKQIKFERGVQPAKVSDVRAMLSLYKVTDEVAETLVRLAKDATRKGWWHSHGDVIPQWFEVFIGLETEATEIRNYQSELIPGLFQTPDYHRAYLRAALLDDGDEAEMERTIEIRRQRQTRLEASDAPAYWAILNEAAIRRFSDTEVARRQLKFLLDRAELPSVTFQILPFSAGMHAAQHLAPFVILGFPESADLDVVYIESQHGSLYLEEKAHVTRYNDVFNHLRAKAYDSDQSQALIAQAIREV
ncbi:helix-turn-helix domain-containing protein [Actinomadura atramentaria]|uniref:helix-turn-helix domain-containing protein n=1 Tax=Actinomadura atramentaria TaxID=1990 RepID=UPI0004778322|nr:helix-turn-helix transcriptional regulator [Actinomadura atramentaria]